MERLQQSRHALGSEAVLTLVVKKERADETFAALWYKVEAFEQRFSRFLPTSELSTFNAHAGAKQKVSGAFQKLLQAARAMAEQTGGLYNPFILPALQRAGYKGSWPAPDIANDQTNYETRGVVA